eukprot:COSAG04_NODE_1092_length_8322_cov_1.935547_6_plen_81_part_00
MQSWDPDLQLLGQSAGCSAEWLLRRVLWAPTMGRGGGRGADGGAVSPQRIVGYGTPRRPPRHICLWPRSGCCSGLTGAPR